MQILTTCGTHPSRWSKSHVCQNINGLLEMHSEAGLCTFGDQHFIERVFCLSAV